LGRSETLASQQLAALHICVGDSQPAQQLPQPDQVLSHLVGRAQVRPSDHFHQGDPAAIEVDQTPIPAMQRLAGVLLHVQFGNGHPPQPAAGQRQVEETAAGQRLVVLADLIALGQVGVEVVLAGEV
jgi:hypothetical protein